MYKGKLLLGFTASYLVVGNAQLLADTYQNQSTCELVFLKVLYMNDVTHCTSSNVNLFADDTSIYIRGISALEIEDKLQNAANDLTLLV